MSRAAISISYEGANMLARLLSVKTAISPSSTVFRGIRAVSAAKSGAPTTTPSAYAEMKEGWHFEHVIANHDGEDSDNWEAFYYPIGDARNALDAVAALIEGVVPSSVEKWEEALLP